MVRLDGIMNLTAAEPTPALLARIASSRDTVAWETVVERYHRVMFWTAKVVVGTSADAEDVVQDALLLVREHAGRFLLRAGDDGEEQARRWILRITANCAISWRRREDRLRRRNVMIDGTQAIAPASETRSGIVELNRALADMAEPQRRPIVLHYYVGLDHHGLAQELSCTLAAARKRLSRSLSELRRRLKGPGVALGVATFALTPAEACDGVHAVLSQPPAQLPEPAQLASWKGLASSPLMPLTPATTIFGGLSSLSLVAAASLGLLACAVVTTASLSWGGAQPLLAGTETTPTPAPSPEPAPPADASVNRPDWASAFGSDHRGAWADLEVGTEVQRFRRIAPGTFRMGSPRSELGRVHEIEALHAVVLRSGFWLADSEVTQALYEEVMDLNPSAFQGESFVDPTTGKTIGRRIRFDEIRRLPVERVSWNDCVAFFARIKVRHPTAVITFPTEAQWEFACRAGTTGGFGVADPQVIFGEHDAPLAVKSGVPNRWGLYDMHGNVAEWCADGFAPYPPGLVADPTGTNATRRVTRGGSFASQSQDCQSARRMRNDLDDRFWHLGFRLCIPDLAPAAQGIVTIDLAAAIRDPEQGLLQARQADPLLARALEEAHLGRRDALVAWIAMAGIEPRAALGAILRAARKSASSPDLVRTRDLLLDDFLAGCPREEESWITVADSVAHAIVVNDAPPDASRLAMASALAGHLASALEDANTDVDRLLDTIACIRYREGDAAAAIDLWKRAATAANSVDRATAAGLYRHRLTAAGSRTPASDLLRPSSEQAPAGAADGAPLEF